MNYSLEEDGFEFVRGAISVPMLKAIQVYAADIFHANDIERGMRMASCDDRLWFDFGRSLADTLPVRAITVMPEFVMRVMTFIRRPVYVEDCAVFYNDPAKERLTYDWHSEKSYFPNAEIMARGSHKKDFAAERSRKPEGGLTQMKVAESDLEGLEKVPCDLELGDACLFRLKTVHKTGVNTSGTPRVSMVVRYADYVGKFMGGWKDTA